MDVAVAKLVFWAERKILGVGPVFLMRLLNQRKPVSIGFHAQNRDQHHATDYTLLVASLRYRSLAERLQISSQFSFQLV